jgi:arsenate reductase
MAEGFAKKYLGEEFEIFSAGIEARGIHPMAVRVMFEKGINISNQTSDVIDLKLLFKANYVITLCRDAHERCPSTPIGARRFHWGFEDPAKATGTEEERLMVFRRVRDEIEQQIRRFAEEGLTDPINPIPPSPTFQQPSEHFGDEIRKLREEKGFSHEELANLLGVTEKYIIQTEQNLTYPSRFFLHRVSQIFNVDGDELIKKVWGNHSLS